MKTNNYNLNELQCTTLSNDELTEINAGDNFFYDAGVVVGSSIVKFFRWMGDLHDAATEEYGMNIA